MHIYLDLMLRPQAPDGAKNIQVGAVIAIVGEEGDDISGAAALASQATSETSSSAQKTPESPTPESPTPAEPSQSTGPPSSHHSVESVPDLPRGERIFASPIAKKIALERGIPLAQVKGTGPSGRIIRSDVENYKASPVAPPASSSQILTAQSSDYTDSPVSAMRRTIAARLSQSKQEVPHYYLTVDINMDKVLKLREVFNNALADKEKTAKLSVNDFVIKAVACALADVPEANSAWMGEVIRT